MTKKPSLKGRVLDGTGTLFVFLAMAAGVTASDRILAGRAQRFTLGDFAFGLAVAAALVGRTELKDSDWYGKRKNLVGRLLNAFAHGVTWRTAMGARSVFGGGQ